MATTHEKREEYSSNVIRVLHPARPISPNPNISNIDNNLDYLLEDLQSSVSPSSYTSSARDVQYLSPANSTTVLRERSVSPGSGGRKVYKTATYQYSSTTGDTLDPPQNVNQLDTLLQDLKTERDITRERDYSHIGSSGIDPGLLEPASNVTKTTRVYKSSVVGGKPTVQRELVFDSADDNLIQGTLPKSSPNYVKKIETKTVRDVSYDPASRYEVKSTEERVIAPQPKTISLDTNALPDDLKNVPLSDDILPVPGTKVTTTVRTYTYEIPAEPTSTTNKTLLYKNESYNTTNTTFPERSVPPSVVFKTESYNTIDRSDGVPPPTQTSTKTIIHKRDIRETTRSGYPPPEDDYPRVTSPPPSNTTIVYKQDVTNTTNTNILPSEPNWGPNYPGNQGPPHQPGQPGHPGQPGYPGQPRQPGQPGQPGPTTTYYYKHESSNTKNTLYGPPSGGSPYPSGGSPYPSGGSPYPSGGSPYPPGDSPYPPHDRQVYPPDQKPHPYPGEPEKPTTVTYKYSSHTTKTSNQGPSPSEREPLLQPAPFPTDGVDHSQTNGTPPKRLDDLMATFNGNAGDRQIPGDETISRKREVDTAVATAGEPKIPSKNIAGPPVYYPPGQELFARKEESSAAYRAQGGYARASGRYEYEAESKSKSKSRSGAAVVPVCLPLCCAMPCSIM